MKNYISLSKKALLLGGAFVMFTSCDDGDLADIYKGSSSGEYVSDVNWTEAANKSTETYIKYFFENAGGRNTFAGGVLLHLPDGALPCPGPGKFRPVTGKPFPLLCLSGHCGRGQPALLFLRRNEDDARG